MDFFNVTIVSDSLFKYTLKKKNTQFCSALCQLQECPYQPISINHNVILHEIYVYMRVVSTRFSSGLSDKIKRECFQDVGVSILLYASTTLTLMKFLDSQDCVLALNKSWKQHLIKQLLYSHLRPISANVKVRRTTNAGHCWRCRFVVCVLWRINPCRLFNTKSCLSYLPTPPLEQDMTQGQFLSGV